MRFDWHTWIVTHKRSLQYGAWLLIGILFLSGIGSYWTSFTNALRLVIAGIFIFFIPGWCATIIFFPHSEQIAEGSMQEGKRHALDLVERVTLAVILSIIISSAVVFILNTTEGAKLTPRNLAIAMMMVNLMLGVSAAWKVGLLSPMFAIPLELFPVVILALNQLFGIPLTGSNLFIETMALCVVIIFLQIVIKQQKVRPNDNELIR